MTILGRKCKLVRLNKSTHVEGVGNVGPQIDKNLATKGRELTLTVVEGGVHFQLGAEEAYLPNENITSCTLYPREKTS